MHTMLQDFRNGLRLLLKDSGFTALGVITLALGIAGNIVIFSFYNSFFLRPFPFKDPERLVDLDQTAPRWNLEYTGLAFPDFYNWRENNRTFESMGAYSTAAFNFASSDHAQRVTGAHVTYDLASVLAINPVLGRLFTPDEDRPGGPKVVLIGYRLWQRAFGGADVRGQTLRLSRESYTIIGVLPRDLGLLDQAELWLPLGESPTSQNGWYLTGVGRLKPGVTIAQARDDLSRIHRALLDQHKTNENAFPRVTSLSERFFGPTRLVLNVFLGAGVLLLLIACGNVTALMLARGMSRAREFGVRLALGASPWRLTRLVASEALLLALLGGALGAVLGYWGLKAMLAALPDMIPAWVHFDYDGRVVLFTSVMVVVAGLMGAGPVIKSALQVSLQWAVQSAVQQSTASGPRRRGLHALVVGELALTLVLMVHAGLLLQAFHQLQKADPGYRPDHLLVYEIALPGAGYPSSETRLAFYENHLTEVRALPGVVAASAVSSPPLGGHWGNFFTVENAPLPGPQDPDPVILQRIAMPSYFETMGIKMLSGRGFMEQDGRNEGSRAVVVNELFAKRAWPNQDAVGKRIRHRGENNPWLTVVGVVQDVKHYGVDRPMIPGVYLPYAHQTLLEMSIVVRSTAPTSTIVSSIRELLRHEDDELPMIGVATMETRLTKSLWARRVYSTLIAVFAGVAVVMAVGGIFGVFSYLVNRRTQEVGVRMALGAQQQDVLWLVLRQAGTLAAWGVGIGLTAALATAPLMRSLLFGVSPAEPLTVAGLTLLLCAVAMLACWLPARRAAKVDPMVALRCE